MKPLTFVASRLSSLAAVIATVCTIALAGTLSADAISRAITGRSLVGMVEMSETLLVAIVFLGLAYCGVTGAHIAMNLVTAALPDRAAAWARTIAYTLVLLLVIWMIFATGDRAVDSFIRAEYKFGLAHWPLWPARSVITLGLILCVPVFLVTLISNVQVALGKRTPTVLDGASSHPSAAV
jgi:TRAP-type C4-dicarboxylate transport system permease small subunit